MVDVDGKRRKDAALRLIALPQKHKAAVLAVGHDSPFEAIFAFAEAFATLLLARHE